MAGTVYQVRYKNLQLLIDKEGGLRNGGLARVAEKLGKSQGQLSHFGGATPIKNIGDKVARQIEVAYALPEGWLDQPHERIAEPGTVYALPSQPAGYGRENLALAVEVARFWIDLHGLPGGVEDHIPLLAIAHELVLEAKEPATVLDLSKKLAARLREETANGTERRDDAEPGATTGAVRRGGGARKPRKT